MKKNFETHIFSRLQSAIFQNLKIRPFKEPYGKDLKPRQRITFPRINCLVCGCHTVYKSVVICEVYCIIRITLSSAIKRPGTQMTWNVRFTLDYENNHITNILYFVIFVHISKNGRMRWNRKGSSENCTTLIVHFFQIYLASYDSIKIIPRIPLTKRIRIEIKSTVYCCNEAKAKINRYVDSNVFIS